MSFPPLLASMVFTVLLGPSIREDGDESDGDNERRSESSHFVRKSIHVGRSHKKIKIVFDKGRAPNI